MHQKALIQRFVQKIFVYDGGKKIRVIINPNRIDLNGLLDTNGGEGSLPPISQNKCYYINGAVILDIAV